MEVVIFSLDGISVAVREVCRMKSGHLYPFSWANRMFQVVQYLLYGIVMTYVSHIRMVYCSRSDCSMRSREENRYEYYVEVHRVEVMMMEEENQSNS